MTVAALPVRRRHPRRAPARRRLSIAASVLLHLLILALLVLAGRMRPKQPEWLPPPMIEMQFEGGAKEAPSVPNDQPKDAHLPPSPPTTPAPAPPALPVPPLAPPPAPAPLPEPPQPPAEPVPEAAVPSSVPQPPAPPEPVPAPSQPAPQAAEPPPAEAEPVAPARPAPPAPPMQSAIQLVPPRLPPPPPLPVPRPTPPARPHPHPAFPAPMAYSFGPAAPRSASRAPARRSGIDLSFAPAGRGADALQPNARSDNKEVGADWLNLVSAWWRRHAYYPPQAGNRGEQGDVTVALTVRRDGKVESVRLEDRSGSVWLDMAAVAVFRDAHLPPLPSDVTAARIPLHFTIHYVLVN